MIQFFSPVGDDGDEAAPKLTESEKSIHPTTPAKVNDSCKCSQRFSTRQAAYLPTSVSIYGSNLPRRGSMENSKDSTQLWERRHGQVTAFVMRDETSN